MDAIEDQFIRADLIVTSGGVSVGTYDVVQGSLGQAGDVRFTKVAMQPGCRRASASSVPMKTRSSHGRENRSALRLIRDLRATGAAQVAGQARSGWRSSRATWYLQVLVAGRKAAVRPSEVDTTRQRHLCRGTARRGVGSQPDGRPGRCERADMVPEQTKTVLAARGSTSWSWSDAARDLPRSPPVDERGAAPHGRSVREGRIGAHGARHWAGPGV